MRIDALLVSSLLVSAISMTVSADDVSSKHAIDSLERTARWWTQLSAYELDVEIKKAQILDSNGKLVTQSQALRETYDSKAKFFASAECTGIWWLDAGTGESSDSLKTVFSIGRPETGVTWTKGFSPTRLSCSGEDCVNAARRGLHGLSPIIFVVPLPEKYVMMQLTDIRRRIVEHPEFVVSEQGVCTIFGEKKSVEKARLTIRTQMIDSNVPEAFGVEICISTSGEDIGFVVSMSWVELKDKSRMFTSDDDVRFRERTVFTQWETVELNGKDVTVPKKCVQSFIETSTGGKEKQTLVQTSTWKFLKFSDVELPNEKGLETVSTELEKKVNKLLNR